MSSQYDISLRSMFKQYDAALTSWATEHVNSHHLYLQSDDAEKTITIQHIKYDMSAIIFNIATLVAIVALAELIFFKMSKIRLVATIAILATCHTIREVTALEIKSLIFLRVTKQAAGFISGIARLFDQNQAAEELEKASKEDYVNMMGVTIFKDTLAGISNQIQAIIQQYARR